MLLKVLPVKYIILAFGQISVDFLIFNVLYLSAELAHSGYQKCQWLMNWLVLAKVNPVCGPNITSGFFCKPCRRKMNEWIRFSCKNESKRFRLVVSDFLSLSRKHARLVLHTRVLVMKHEAVFLPLSSWSYTLFFRVWGGNPSVWFF